MTKNNLGRKWFISTYNCKEENLGHELKVEIWKKNLKQKQWRASYSLDLHVFILHTPGSPGVQEYTIHRGWPLAYQSLIMKMSQVLLIGQTYRDIFSIVVLFSDMSRSVSNRLKKKKKTAWTGVFRVKQVCKNFVWPKFGPGNSQTYRQTYLLNLIRHMILVSKKYDHMLL